MSDTSYRFETISYHSTVDNTGPLYADVAVPNNASNVPMLAVMHGYHGERKDVADDVKRYASKGLCAIGVDMRGRSDSAGTPDSGAVEIYDIVDALDAAAAHLGGAVDTTNQNIVGYSGGGGNALSAATKFPDRFRIAVSYFGISDYALWYDTTDRQDCRNTMSRWIGGDPAHNRTAYAARNSFEALANCRGTHIHLFWDSEETACPPILNKRLLGRARELGMDTVFGHTTTASDDVRWYHGSPQTHPELLASEDIFVSQILQGRVPRIQLPETGRLWVPGYVSCRYFDYWIGDGCNGAGLIDYELRSGQVRITRLA